MFLELKIPPPIVGLLAAALMWLCSHYLPALTLFVPYHKVFAFLLGGVGFVFDLVAITAFIRYKTTINPLNPDTTSALVTSGIYTRTRNPMYVGLLLLLIGWGFYLSNVLAALWLPVFVFYITRFQIEPEESKLTEKFGSTFLAYKQSVRRWL